MKKKTALLVAFHFPPQAGSSGIQRTLSFSKYLRRHGWEALVLSANARAYEQHNDSQLASLPGDLVVQRAFALDTKRHLGFGGRYLELMALPDRWVSWLAHGVVAGLRLVRRHQAGVIWSTFPIATAHLIGLVLHRLTGLPWIADFRDPMMQPAYPTSARQRAIYGWIEKQAMQRCSFAVFTTQRALETCKARFPNVDPAKFRVIENGFDEEEFGRLMEEATAPQARGRRVTLLHSGILYKNGRNPAAFLEALAVLKAAGGIDAGSLRVILRAPGDVPGVAAQVTALGLDDVVEVLPPLSYREALNEMLAADGLLLFQGTPFNNQIPAKIYEYFRARKPVLGLVDPVGETAAVLRGAGFDDIVDPDASAQIAAALERFIPAVRDGSAHIADDEVVARASRAHKARELADLFDEAAA
ncbi:glycosyltransferase [Massilia sp. BKSP1R2A-1]|uniref:glycosyltransferase n=1 Tax=Massilia sp. BKSP1R2A-1 TaxID=3422595 RepID=UPI003D356976